MHRALGEKADRFWEKVDRMKHKRRKRKQKVQPQTRYQNSGKRTGSQKRTRKTDVRGYDEGGGTDARVRKTEVQVWGDEGGVTEVRVWKPEVRADGQGGAPAFQEPQAPAATPPIRNKSMRPIPDDEWFMQYEGIMKAAGGGVN